MTWLREILDRKGALPVVRRIGCRALRAAALVIVLPVVSFAAPDASVSLRLSRELSQPRPVSALERELFRLERRTLQMLNEGKDDPQAVSEKLTWLEADLAELKRAEAWLVTSAVAVSMPSAARSGQPLAVAGAAPASTAPAAAGPLPTALEQISSASEVLSRPWMAVAGLTTAALLLCLLILRRRHGAAGGMRVPRRQLALARPVVIAPDPLPMAGEAAAAASMVALSGSGLASQAPAREMTPAPEQTLELAEIMLSFGRVSGAAKTLEEYLAENPKESVPPWIRLLRIYQHHDMRDEFEALTRKLNQNFNIEIIRWDSGASRGELGSPSIDAGQEKPREKVDTLEEMPWIRDRIVALWGKPECLVYLRKLLRDHRDGQRSGFTLPVVEELLFLIDLIAARQAVR